MPVEPTVRPEQSANANRYRESREPAASLGRACGSAIVTSADNAPTRKVAPMRAAGDGRHMLAVLSASVLWGTFGTVAHQAPPGSSQLLVGLSTFGFGGLILLALDVHAPGRLVRDRRTTLLLFAGVLGVVGHAGMYYVSMSLVGVAVGNALALGSAPVFAAMLERVVDHRPVRGEWAGATAVCVVGVALLAVGARSEPGTNPLVGVVLGLGAGFGYALYAWTGGA